jgi:L-ascorbate metabolism protein UlaG (beta-lactamase superfamily)
VAEAAPSPGPPAGCTLTWIGHATIQIDLDGTRLVTDPVLARRVAHLRRMVSTPAVPVGVDAALVSHLHHDHLHPASLRALDPVRIVAPAGARGPVPEPLRRRLIEVREGDDVGVEGVRVRAVHAAHDGRRSRGRLRAPALGYVVCGSRRVYFPGDTDLFPAMADLATPPLDVALLPVWGWGPSLGPGHLNPLTAAQALTLLRPRVAIPIHWGTYAHAWATAGRRYLRRPAEDFARHAARLAPDVEVRVLAPGEALRLAGPPATERS